MADTGTPTGTEAPAPSQTEVVASLFGKLRLAESAPETPIVAPEAPEEPAAPEDTPAAAEEPAAEETPSEATPQKMKFLIDNEEVDEDTLVGWKKDGLRQAAFTKKTTELAEQRKQMESERAKEREQTLAEWQKLQQAVDAVVPKEPDWTALRNQVQQGTLPEADYQRFAAQWLADKQQRDLIAAKTAEAEKAVQADRQKAAELQAEANAQRVFELLPDWKDEGKRKAHFGEMMGYIKSIAPDVEAQDVMAQRPEFFKVVADALAYHKLMAQTNAPPKVKLVTPLKPGGQTTTPKTNPVEAAKRRVAQTKTVKDAARLFGALREAGLDT